MLAVRNICQNLQENACTGDILKINLQEVGLLYLKRLLHMCFPVNFLKLVRTAFSYKTCEQLLMFQLKNFTINYDLAKYLMTFTIIIDFVENV